ncbi:MAG: Asp-tRNA(Asn)/Glu-tRNA(Gln) amidotransferase subunit GatC [Candidatus Lokiarchaeota archaeon]|nr:Asp-tRNA(Asn)/Glu-tRNA(Gln) amidotransferase subunit GatC [Candidatus Lokiarchaeota archaeon]
MSEKEDFSEETLEHISKLALLELSGEEKNKLAKELGNILNYFKKLNDLDTTDVKPMTHPIEGLKNVFREDIPWKSLSNEEALKNAKHTKDGYFKANKVLKS